MSEVVFPLPLGREVIIDLQLAASFFPHPLSQQRLDLLPLTLLLRRRGRRAQGAGERTVVEEPPGGGAAGEVALELYFSRRQESF